jgi:hypothetical protein
MNEEEKLPLSLLERGEKLWAWLMIGLGIVYGAAAPVLFFAFLSIMTVPRPGIADPGGLSNLILAIGMFLAGLTPILLAPKKVRRWFMRGLMVGFVLLLLGIGLLVGVCFFAIANHGI